MAKKKKSFALVSQHQKQYQGKDNDDGQQRSPHIQFITGTRMVCPEDRSVVGWAGRNPILFDKSWLPRRPSTATPEPRNVLRGVRASRCLPRQGLAGTSTSPFFYQQATHRIPQMPLERSGLGEYERHAVGCCQWRQGAERLQAVLRLCSLFQKPGSARVVTLIALLSSRYRKRREGSILGLGSHWRGRRASTVGGKLSCARPDLHERGMRDIMLELLRNMGKF